MSSLQYFCSSCNTILKEIPQTINVHTSEECPKCGSLLSETLLPKQQRPAVITQLPKFKNAYSSFGSLNFDIAALDSILQLKVGESVCIIGQYAKIIRDRLIVRALLPERHAGFDSPNVIIIDAGNDSDVYQCINFARQYGLDIKDILRRTIVSRPFTIYQLSDLIIFELPKILEKYKTRIIFLSDLLHLFLQDPNCEINEAKYLIKQITNSIQRFLDTALVTTTIHDNKHSIQRQFLIPKFDKTIEITNNGMVTVRCRNKKQSTKIEIIDLSIIRSNIA